ncbi:MAG: hypothetical protein SOX32_05580 [Candidatus Choladocola sp.]|nr:hypothetical protein [Candidatus Choladocola sp.]
MRILDILLRKRKKAGDETGAESRMLPKTDGSVKSETPPKPFFRLGDGYYLAYEQKPNGLGGYCSVNACLYKGNTRIRRMTDKSGRFLEFPGVEHGDWEKNLTFPFEAVTRFTISYNPFDQNGLAEFFWLVQPDGRYWADDDGFGMEDDREIKLCASFDKDGRFVSPFRIKQ